MTPEAENAVLDFLLEAWLSAMDHYTYRGEREKIKGAWLTLHTPVPSGSHFVKTPVIRARFLDNDGLRDPDLHGFQLFEAEHMDWGGDRERPPSSNWGKPHVIGLCQFAEVIGTKNILVTTSWGQLFGRGLLVRVTPQGELTVRSWLWKS